ncbi:MAG: ParB/RepB/Spo0J family partition protein [Ignavibacteria bacterium]|nr:ParB/RepB/Spo0J family partition protein [Ignavibacteria bacterium]
MTKDKPKGGLGKGLDILFGGNSINEPSQNSENVHKNITELNPEQNNTEQNDEQVLLIEIDKIKANPYQPRKDFDSAELDDLTESIRQKGVIQAVTVRRIDDKNFELISGERRLRAAKLAGLEKIPSYVIDINSKEDLLEIALIENIQRANLNAIEIAEGYKRLIDECSLKQEEVAVKVGKSRSTVTNTIRLLGLPDEIKLSIKKGEISEGHARSILAMDSDVERLLLWKKITTENLNVRSTEEIVKKKKPKSKVKGKKIYEITDQNKAAIKFLEEKFMEHFGTRVRLSPSSPTTGNIVIEYYTAEDLERIIDLCKKH